MKSLLVISVLVVSSDLLADVLPNPVEHLDRAPYHFSGRIYQPHRPSTGSGVVIASDRSVVTAAHVAYDLRDDRWFSFVRWQIREEEERIVVRSVRGFASYGEALEEHPENSPQVFTHDFALLIGYEPLSDSGYADILTDASVALTGSGEKVMIGFPSGLYDSDDPLSDRMHETGPFTDAFSPVVGDYFLGSGIGAGPGASGGGVWVEENGVWKIGGIIVSGLSVSLGGAENTTGIVAINERQKGLIAEAVELAGRVEEPQITAGLPTLIEADWEQDTELRVDYFSVPEVWVEWFYADRRDLAQGFTAIRDVPSDMQLLGAIEEDHFVLTIPAGSTFWNNKVFFAKISNFLGEVETSTVHFRYDGAIALQIEEQPQSLVLDGNRKAVFSTRIDGFPAPLLEWQIRLPGAANFKAVRTIANLSEDWDSESLTVFPRGGYASGATFRLRADNGNELLYSDEVSLSYTDVGEVNVVVASGPEGVLRMGETLRLELANLGTLETEVYWVFTDAFGRGKNWSDAPVLTITNEGQPIHGWTVQGIVKGTYYEAGPNGPIERNIDPQSGPIWRLEAEGPPQVDRNLSYVYNSAIGRLEISADWRSFSAPEIEWQMSLDGGENWYAMSKTQGNPWVFDPDKYLGNGAIFRAKVGPETSQPFITEPLSIRGAANEFSRHETNVVPTSDRGSVALRGDALLAQVAVFERQRIFRVQFFELGEDNFWRLSDSLTYPFPSEFWTSLKPLFVSDDRLLVSCPIYSTAEHSRCGAIVEFVKGADGAWAAGALITAPDPRTDGFFGEDFDFDEETLIVSERNYDPPSRVLIFRLQDGQFVWEQNLDFPGNYVSGWDVSILGTKASFQGFIFERNETTGWQYADSISLGYSGSAGFLDADGSHLAYQGGSFTSEGLIEWWRPNGEGSYEWDSTLFCWIGSRIDHNPTIANPSTGRWHGVRVTVPSSNDGRVVIFGVDTTGESLAMSGISVESRYSLEDFTFNETTLALVVRDSEKSWESGMGWETWCIPFKEVVPVGQSLLNLPLDTVVRSSPELGRHVSLCFRRSNDPAIETRILRSTNMKDWETFVPESSAVTISNPDTDGDGKVSLVEVSLPPESSGQIYFYQLREERL